MIDFSTDENALVMLIEQNITNITNDIKQIQKLIIDLSKINNIDSYLKKNFIDAQSIGLQKIINKFRHSQKNIKKKLKNKKKIGSNNYFWNQSYIRPKNKQNNENNNNNTINNQKHLSKMHHHNHNHNHN
jgi:hypothetical protein